MVSGRNDFALWKCDLDLLKHALQHRSPTQVRWLQRLDLLDRFHVLIGNSQLRPSFPSGPAPKPMPTESPTFAPAPTAPTEPPSSTRRQSKTTRPPTRFPELQTSTGSSNRRVMCWMRSMVTSRLRSYERKLKSPKSSDNSEFSVGVSPRFST